MSRKSVVSLAALMTAGVALLSACGNDTTTGTASSAPATVDTSVQEQAGQVDESTVNSLFFERGTAKTAKAQQGTGDWATGPDGTYNTAAKDVRQKWVELHATQLGKFNPALVNGAKRTLYVFDKDAPNVSNCQDEKCATTWPAVTVAQGSKIILGGVKTSAIGVIKRQDGTLQITINKHPIYFFSGDKKAGDTNGDGVGGTWHVSSPTGAPAPGSAPGTGGTPANPAPNNNGGNNGGAAGNNDGNVKKATVVNAFELRFLNDSGDIDNVTKAGCTTFRAARTSLTTDGSVKVWDGPNCTGTSKVITEDIGDAAAELGFTKGINSVFLG
jgi:predicted lipoprotein with Yx(FWY)xxD motif